MNTKRDNKKTYVLLGVLVATVCGLAIAYAALSANLDVQFGTVTQNIQSWNVAFDTTTSPVTATVGGTSATGRVCGTATVTADTVTVGNTQLSKPGDKCTWPLKINNTGTIVASLGNIVATKPIGSCDISTPGVMVCGKITYKLTTDAAGSTALTTGTTINGSNSLNVYLSAEYTGTMLTTGEAVVQSSAAFRLVFDQA